MVLHLVYKCLILGFQSVASNEAFNQPLSCEHKTCFSRTSSFSKARLWLKLAQVNLVYVETSGFYVKISAEHLPAFR